jgi:hypothetical protein
MKALEAPMVAFVHCTPTNYFATCNHCNLHGKESIPQLLSTPTILNLCSNHCFVFTKLQGILFPCPEDALGFYLAIHSRIQAVPGCAECSCRKFLQCTFRRKNSASQTKPCPVPASAPLPPVAVGTAIPGKCQQSGSCHQGIAMMPCSASRLGCSLHGRKAYICEVPT